MHRLLLKAISEKNDEVITSSIDGTPLSLLSSLTADGSSVAIHLVIADNVKMLQHVLKRYPSLLHQKNKKDETPFSVAMKFNRFAALTLLQSKGCKYPTKKHQLLFQGKLAAGDVNSKSLMSVDQTGMRLIDYVAVVGNADLLSELINREKLATNELVRLLGHALVNHHDHLFPILIPLVEDDIIDGELTLLAEKVGDDSEAHIQLGKMLPHFKKKQLKAYKEFVSVLFIYENSKSLESFIKNHHVDHTEVREAITFFFTDLDTVTSVTIGAIARGLKSFFIKDPDFLRTLILKFIQRNIPTAAVWLCVELPLETVKVALNGDVESEVLRELMQRGQYDIFYLMVGFGADVNVKNKIGRTVKEEIEADIMLKQSLSWGSRSSPQAYFSTIAEFYVSMAKCRQEPSMDLDKCKQMVGRIQQLQCHPDFMAGVIGFNRDHYTIGLLEELFRTIAENRHVLSDTVLQQFFFIKKQLINLIRYHNGTELNHYTSSARLSIAIGSYNSALNELIQCVDAREEYYKKRKEPRDPFFYLQLSYSRLILTVIVTCEVEINQNFSKLPISLSDLKSKLVGLELLPFIASSKVNGTNIEQAITKLTEFSIVTTGYSEVAEKDLNDGEIELNIRSMEAGLENLNAWLDQQEQLMKAGLLKPKQALESLVKTSGNAGKIKALESFYRLRLTIYAIADKLLHIQKRYVKVSSHKEFEKNFNEGKSAITKNSGVISLLLADEFAEKEIPAVRPTIKDKKSKAKEDKNSELPSSTSESIPDSPQLPLTLNNIFSDDVEKSKTDGVGFMQRLLLDAIHQSHQPLKLTMLQTLPVSVLSDLNEDETTAAIELARQGDVEGLKIIVSRCTASILKKENKKRETPLRAALLHQQPEATRFLLKSGCEFDGVIIKKIYSSDPAKLSETEAKEMEDQDKRNFILEYAAARGSNNWVKFLFEKMKEHGWEIQYSNLLKRAIVNRHYQLFPSILAGMNGQIFMQEWKKITEDFSDQEEPNAVLEKMLASLTDKDDINESIIINLILEERTGLLEERIRTYEYASLPGSKQRQQLINTIAIFLISIDTIFNRKTIAAIAKGFEKDFQAYPIILIHVICKLISSGKGGAAYYFMASVPRAIARAALNTSNSEIMRAVLDVGSIGLFYRFIYLGADLTIKNAAGISLEDSINGHPFLQRNVMWGVKGVFQEFFTDVMKLDELLEEFSLTKKLNEDQAKAVIGKIKGTSLFSSHYDEWKKKYINDAIKDVCHILNGNSHNLENTFFQGIFTLLNLLIDDSTLQTEMYFLIRARLEFLLENYKGSLDDLLRFLKMSGTKSSLKVLELHYSVLVLNLASVFRLKLDLSVGSWLKQTVSDFTIGYTIGDGCFLNSSATSYQAHEIKKASDTLEKGLLNLRSHPVTANSADEVVRRVMSTFFGVESLDRWLNQLEQQIIDSRLKAKESIMTIRASDYSEDDLELFRQFYHLRVSVYKFISDLRNIQKIYFHSDKLKSLDSMFLAYGKSEDRVKKARDYLDVIVFEEKKDTQLVVSKNPKKIKENSQAKKEEKEEVIEKVEASEESSLPTWYPDVPRGHGATPLVTASTRVIKASSSPMLFPPSQPSTRPLAYTLPGEVVKLRQIGKNSSLPDALLCFVNLFEPNTIYFVGSLVSHLHDATFPLPKDADMVVTISQEKLKSICTDKNVIKFEERGQGGKKSYYIEYKRSIDQVVVPIDIVILGNPELGIDERLKKDSEGRDVTVNAVYYDPYKNKKQFIDFYQGRMHLNQRKLVLINPYGIDVFYQYPLRIFRIIRLHEQDWKLSDDVVNQIKAFTTTYQGRFFEVDVRPGMIKLYRCFGKNEAEVILHTYQLDKDAKIQSEMKYLSEHPELYCKEEKDFLSSNPTFSVLQVAKK